MRQITKTMQLPMLFPLGVIGVPQAILIVVAIILLFGARRIPELMRGAGRGIKEFKDAMNKDYTAENDTRSKPRSEEEEKE